MTNRVKKICVSATIFACLISAFLPACIPKDKTIECTVAIVLPEDATSPQPLVTVNRGDDATFSISLPEDRRIVFVGYDDYTLGGGETASAGRRYFELTLHSVRYSEYIEVQSAAALTTQYLPNGGEGDGMTITENPVHLRPVSLNAESAFERQGYIQTGWNTAADGTGEHYSFGGRLNHDGDELTLYAEWQKENPAADFGYEQIAYSDNLMITSCLSDADEIAVPESIGGKKVVGISDGAFTDREISKLVLPDSIIRIESGAFDGCNIEKLVMFDNVTDISSQSFTNCTLSTLYLNARQKPTFSGSYFDTFADKYDRLYALKDQKKIILTGGSSVRFGFDSMKIERELEGYSAVNMGVYAYANMRPQLELISLCAKEGDIVLHGTEFDAIDEQFCVSDTLGYEIFAMCESNYDLLSLLDLTGYDGIFDSFRQFNDRRKGMIKKSYDISPSDYDEDGNPSASPVYNSRGDYVLYRKNNEEMKNFGVKRAYYNKKYFPESAISDLNGVLAKLGANGAEVLYAYTPRMNTSLSDDSDRESIIALDIYLNERLSVPIISDIESSLYSPLYFFGTDNHLSTEGAEIHTANIIADLKKYLAANA